MNATAERVLETLADRARVLIAAYQRDLAEYSREVEQLSGSIAYSERVIRDLEQALGEEHHPLVRLALGAELEEREAVLERTRLWRDLALTNLGDLVDMIGQETAERDAYEAAVAS